MKNRQRQPYRLHNELWDNQPEELNDGPACRCSLKARKFGIRHGIYQVWSLTKFYSRIVKDLCKKVCVW